MQSQSLTDLARTLTAWQPRKLHDCGEQQLKLIHASVQQFEFDIHDRPETLIAIEGPYAIETPQGEIPIPEGSAFTVPPGLPHRPANRETCVILVLS
jgi:mannose-6-phosphate isomerase-like protein (cupin superfamily)